MRSIGSIAFAECLLLFANVIANCLKVTVLLAIKKPTALSNGLWGSKKLFVFRIYSRHQLEGCRKLALF